MHLIIRELKSLNLKKTCFACPICSKQELEWTEVGVIGTGKFSSIDACETDAGVNQI